MDAPDVASVSVLDAAEATFRVYFTVKMGNGFLTVSCEVCHQILWSGKPALFSLTAGEVFRAVASNHAHRT